MQDWQMGTAAVLESESGASFPEQIGTQTLVATGVRRKFGAVKVYAVGLYLDKGSKLWGKAPAAAQLVQEGLGHAALRLVITSSLVTQEKLLGALRESVEPRLEGFGEPRAEQVLEEFGAALLKGPKLKPSTVILFSLGQAGVRLEIDQGYSAEIKSAALAKALLATYVDAKAVAPKFRDAVLLALSR